MKKDDNYQFREKWSPQITKSGYTAIPNLLIRNQKKLGITTSEMVVLLGLLMHKWTSENPYPSVGSLSAYNGLDHKTIRKHLRSLEKKRVIKRIPRIGQTNEYDFMPLIQRLDCYTRPTQIRVPHHSQTRGSPYSNLSTKEEAAKKTQRKRRSAKPESIGNIMKNQYGE